MENSINIKTIYRRLPSKRLLEGHCMFNGFKVYYQVYERPNGGLIPHDIVLPEYVAPARVMPSTENFTRQVAHFAINQEIAKALETHINSSTRRRLQDEVRKIQDKFDYPLEEVLAYGNDYLEVILQVHGVKFEE